MENFVACWNHNYQDDICIIVTINSFISSCTIICVLEVNRTQYDDK